MEAGFPPGVINLISGAGDTGALLASHMDIDKIAFTGSAATGRKVQVAAAQSNLKHVTLELGGKSPSLVFEDAPLEHAIAQNSQSFLLNSGQACSAASRLFVQEGIAPQFIEGIKQSFLQLAHSAGDPSDEKTFLGPLVDKIQRDRVTDYIKGAKADDIEVLAGGEEHTGTGQFVTPTVFLNPKDDSRIYREEIFGPVLIVRTFKTEEEALALANDTIYGLSGK
jgi:aldehyde dehydrogenase (NAD+)